MKRLTKKSILHFLLIMFVITLLFELIDIPVAEKGNPDSFIKYLDTKVPVYLKKYTTAGLSVGLIHDGKIIFLKGYGYADLDKKISVTEKTLFQAASVSKPVAAVGIMRLVEKGNISLDSPVQNYLTRWHFPEGEYDSSEVTIRRLLSHSAGLANPAYGYDGSESPDSLRSIEESLSHQREGVKIEYKPGTQYLYSGVGYTLLQLLIEEQTGLRFNDYMKKAVLSPLKMDSSTYESGEVDQKNLAIVYSDEGNALPNLYFTEKAAAGLYSNTEDLSEFVLSMIPADTSDRHTNLLKPETLKEINLPQKDIKDRQPFGLGFALQKPLFRDYYEVYHYGTQGPGWISYIAFFPDKKEGIVMLSNSPGGQAIRYQIRTSWLQWVTGSTNYMMKIQKLVNILKIIIPVTFFGLILLSILLFIKSRMKLKN
ncbi:MAG: beta-lactamase family protein [Spirochaetes bacterium]|nr:beta-lactamase family protein [Spirochaetota bacterium]